MTSKNPREPRNVKKLIAEAKARKVESAVVRYIKRIIASDNDRRNGHGGGTRGSRR